MKRMPKFLSKLPLVFLLCLIFVLILFFYQVIINNRRPIQDKVFKGIAWFNFEDTSSLKGWEERIFKGKVTYTLKRDSQGGYLDALSQDAASGLVHWIKFNPSKFPMIKWKWKVVKFPQGKETNLGDSWWFEKDDYAARFYIIFPRFPLTRYRCLEYVWDKKLAVGSVLTNPNFNNLKIIVTESGEANLGKWVTVERNIIEDYRLLFGGKPGQVGAIAIMTDSENTKSTAQAQYNDIEVGYEKQ